MKEVIKIITAVLLLSLPISSNATVNTLTLIDSYSDGSDTICVYSGSGRTETYVKEGAGHCPRHMTFGSKDE